MATATPTKPRSKAIAHATTPLTLWHLLSLDAPTVSVLWTWFIAASNHILLPHSSTFAVAVTVWTLYAADRLMDASLLDTDPATYKDLEARHYFHHRHRPAFLTGIVFASIALATLLPRLDTEAIHLYLVLGALVVGYFILIHARSTSAQQILAHRMPKEIAVGLCFAAATFIPTVSRRPDLRLPLLPSALLFAALCSLNCLFIYAWEHEDSRTNPPAHPITQLALRNLPLLTTLLLLTATLLALFDPQAPRTIPSAIAAAASLLLLLHLRRLTISRITLRAAADLALTTPLLLLPLLLR